MLTDSEMKSISNLDYMRCMIAALLGNIARMMVLEEGLTSSSLRLVPFFLWR